MSFDIPLFKLNYGDAERQAVLDTLDSRWISMGPRCAQLEAEFCRQFGASHALATSSCTSALHLALRALGIGAGDEVIVPSLTFVASANAVKYVGADPVFCDIVGLENPNLDHTSIEALITPRTRAIMVVHFAGFPCAMDEILRTARAKNLFVIEDACHGPLSEYGGQKLGTLGDVGCFSFFSNKNISTGEGGMLLCRDLDVLDRAKLMRSHGMTTMSFERASGHATSYDVVELGYNYRLDDIRAALALVQLGKLRSDLEQRSRARATYEEYLREIDGVLVPFAGHREFVSNYIFPVVLRGANALTRDAVRARLGQQGIQTSVHYPPVHRFSIYKGGRLPRTERYAESTITLPMYGSLSAGDISRVCSALDEALD